MVTKKNWASCTKQLRITHYQMFRLFQSKQNKLMKKRTSSSKRHVTNEKKCVLKMK